MARRMAELPKGCRITDHISLGVIIQAFPMSKVKDVLARTGKAGRRQRDLPANVMVYYVIALALYLQVSYREVLRCLLEGLPGWLSRARHCRSPASRGFLRRAAAWALSLGRSPASSPARSLHARSRKA